MAIVKGICKNFGECDLADGKVIQEVDKSNFICEECGKPLHSTDGAKTNKNSKVNPKLIGIITAAILLLCGVGYGIFALLGGNNKPTSIKFNKKGITVTVGETVTVSPTIEPAGTKVSLIFKRKGDCVKVAKNGKVIALKEGKATILVMCKEYPKLMDTIGIKVINVLDHSPVLIQKLTFNEQSLTLKVGEKKQLTCVITPEKHDEGIIKTSSNINIAEISENGEVTAKSAGSAVITYKTEKSGVTTSINVTVKSKHDNVNYGGNKGGNVNTNRYGTVKLSYGTYKGELKDGQPHGHGVVTFSTTRRIVSSQDYVAHPGDTYEGEWRNGVLSGGLGYWRHNGEVTGIRP